MRSGERRGGKLLISGSGPESYEELPPFDGTKYKSILRSGIGKVIPERSSVKSKFSGDRDGGLCSKRDNQSIAPSLATRRFP